MYITVITVYMPHDIVYYDSNGGIYAYCITACSGPHSPASDSYLLDFRERYIFIIYKKQTSDNIPSSANYFSPYSSSMAPLRLGLYGSARQPGWGRLYGQYGHPQVPTSGEVLLTRP